MKRFSVKNNGDIFVGEYPFHQKLKDELVPLLEEYPDQQGKRTNVKANHTEWDWLPENHVVKEFKRSIMTEIDIYYGIKPIGGSPPPLEMTNFWGMVYNKGDYTKPHHHLPNFIYSFAYFLKSKWYHPPLIFTHSGKKIPSKEGTYVIFQSHMVHHVPKNKSNEPRITLSGNLKIKES
mgnify:CR=1 FL=1|tara:strand:- start:39 stop:572 length:534 start_codon:yes stop_codon:yes gene_type:complete